MLVVDSHGVQHNVIGRLLVKRKVSDLELDVRAGLADIAAGRVREVKPSTYTELYGWQGYLMELSITRPTASSHEPADKDEA